MSDRDAPRAYGVRIGLLSGLFAIGQVLLSVAAAHGAEAPLRAIQRAISMLMSGGLVDPTLVAPALIPMLLSTYFAMLVAGLVTTGFAYYAGRLAAIAQGRRAGGAVAGMWVWLVSSGIWLLASIVATLITHTDGTVSGVFVGTFNGDFLGQQLFFLLAQEIAAALVCLGFCALAGSQGARHAPGIPPQAPVVPLPRPVGYPPQGAYPYAPYPQYPVAPGYSYPTYPGYPPQPGQPPHPTYPAYPAHPTYPGYPAPAGYPPAGWGAAPNAPGAPNTPNTPNTPGAPYPPGVSAPTPPQPPTNPIAAPVAYPPPPSFYVPEQPKPIEQPARPSASMPQPEQG